PRHAAPPDLHSFPTRRSSDLVRGSWGSSSAWRPRAVSSTTTAVSTNSSPPTATPSPRSRPPLLGAPRRPVWRGRAHVSDQVSERSEEHTSELQSRENLVCRLL